MFPDHCQDIRLDAVLSYTCSHKISDVKGRPYHALTYRLSGSSGFEQGGHRYTVKEGQMSFMPADTDYRHYSGGEDVIVLHFYMPTDTPLSLQIFAPEESGIFKDAFVSLERIWREKQAGYYLQAMSVFYKLLYQLKLHFSPDPAGDTYRKIRPAVQYVHQHPEDPDLSIPALCAMLDMSDTYFRELFFDVFGCTPLQYINARRIDLACDLLSDNTLSVSEIAARCGFADAKYFATVFKKYKGCSPSKYKK